MKFIVVTLGAVVRSKLEKTRYRFCFRTGKTIWHTEIKWGLLGGGSFLQPA